MSNIKLYDIVIIDKYRGTINEKARVIIKLAADCWYVSNIGQPYNGTLSIAFEGKELTVIEDEVNYEKE